MDEPLDIRELAAKDGRYHVDAFFFVQEALEHTLHGIGQRRHVTGRELSEGARDYAVEKYGFMARIVLEEWGVKRTRDIGEIVYLMIEWGVMNRTDEDSIADFDDVYSFDDAFDAPFRIG
jgi:uncharacterized repeat protein (TIGR04138 family)